MVTNVVAIGGLVGLIVSVILLSLQTRAVVQQTKTSNAIAQATVISNASSNLHRVFQIFIERPELKPYFYESKKPPSRDDQRARVAMVAEMLGDIFEDGLVAHRLQPTFRTYESWESYCRLVVTTSPIMNELMQGHPDWWPQLREAVGTLKGFATSSPQPDRRYRVRGTRGRGSVKGLPEGTRRRSALDGFRPPPG